MLTSTQVDGSRSAPGRPAVDVAAGRLALSVSGPGDVSMVPQVHEPGEASARHAHTGL